MLVVRHDCDRLNVVTSLDTLMWLKTLSAARVVAAVVLSSWPWLSIQAAVCVEAFVVVIVVDKPYQTVTRQPARQAWQLIFAVQSVVSLSLTLLLERWTLHMHYALWQKLNFHNAYIGRLKWAIATVLISPSNSKSFTDDTHTGYKRVNAIYWLIYAISDRYPHYQYKPKLGGWKLTCTPPP